MHKYQDKCIKDMTIQTHSDDEISLKGEKYKAKNIRPPVFPHFDKHLL